jgi:hypothetical protein
MAIHMVNGKLLFTFKKISFSHHRLRWWTLNLPRPYELFEGGRYGQGQPPKRNQDFLGPYPKLLPAPSDFEKTIALAIFNATYPILSALHLQGPKSNIYVTLSLST